MASQTLTTTGDTRIENFSPTSNYGTNTTLEVGHFQPINSTSRGLLKFNLASVGGVISEAVLRVYDNGTNLGSNTRTLRVYRSKRAWTETGATWNKYDGTNNWTTAGSGSTADDYDNTEVGSVSVPGTEVAGYIDITLTASLVEAMRTGTFTDNGFFLKLDTENTDMHEFSSREGSNPPQLVLTLTPTINYLKGRRRQRIDLSGVSAG